jgi:hypothetical protein
MLTPSPSGARWPEPQPLANPGRFTDGSVAKGPAAKPLAPKQVSVQGDAISLD